MCFIFQAFKLYIQMKCNYKFIIALENYKVLFFDIE